MYFELESRSTSTSKTLYGHFSAYSMMARSGQTTLLRPTSSVLVMHTPADAERAAAEPVTSDSGVVQRVPDALRANPDPGNRDGFCLSQFVERSTEASKVPLRVRDRQTLHAIVALLDPQYSCRPPTMDITDRPTTQERVTPGRGGWTMAHAS